MYGFNERIGFEMLIFVFRYLLINLRALMMENQLSDMIQSLSISSNECRIHARKQLDLWLDSSLTLLREAYNEKLNEIDQLFDILTKDLEVYKQRQLITIIEQKTDPLNQEIEVLQKQLPTLIQVKNIPGSVSNLEICRSTNIIDRPTEFSILRHALSRKEPVQSYRYSSTCRAMGCDSKQDIILLYDKDELILYNINGTLGGSVSWPTIEDGFVSDITWCSILDSFLVLGRMALSSFNTHLYTCTRIPQVRGSQSHHLIALAYVEKDKSVFICCHHPQDTIRQYGTLPEWNLQRTWSKNNLINQDDVGIRCIRVNSSNTQLGLVIKNKNDQFRVGLYSMDLTHLFAAIPINTTSSSLKGGRSIDFMLYLTPFIDDHLWLVIYGNGIHEHSLLLINSETGKSETIIDDSILNASMLDEQYLIVRMKQSMSIYDIQ
ncbi:unnamed protein product [Rotaria magnacalcarata]|uniref:Uncharacterized protein n=5 Tax=Rotaria magnacalcarata TaxID=392030 RepID=A0A816CCJ4_9BILA|nr:unnamed protein product [Rotaria magnacalcarata]CAF1618611.1 unnamed protein product [Rotaria magnacalcarata]CAF3899186.1 unnamed protein product [Rotaria magnacalcarata]CAF3943567.1 unnamed protein product [Rotaria magnacalcarata]